MVVTGAGARVVDGASDSPVQRNWLPMAMAMSAAKANARNWMTGRGMLPLLGMATKRGYSHHQIDKIRWWCPSGDGGDGLGSWP